MNRQVIDNEQLVIVQKSPAADKMAIMVKTISISIL